LADHLFAIASKRNIVSMISLWSSQAPIGVAILLFLLFVQSSSLALSTPVDYPPEVTSRKQANGPLNGSLWWFAPIISNSGYGHEAIEYLNELEILREENGVLRHSQRVFLSHPTTSDAAQAGEQRDAEREVQLSLIGCSHHGDEMLPWVLDGHEPQMRRRLLRMLRTRKPDGRRSFVERSDIMRNPVLTVCHSEPGAWWAPTPMYDTVECPTTWSTVAVGRTMFETDRIPSGWPSRLAYMREIWVPTEFHRQTFMQSGVAADKLFVIPESIDARDRWNPAKYEPNFFETHQMKKAGNRCDFKFLSVFKWEERKGWDVLLSAFFEAFIFPLPTSHAAGRDGETPVKDTLVCLFLKTSAYHSEVDDGDDDEYDAQVSTFLFQKYKKEHRIMRRQINQNLRKPRWLQIHVISSTVPDEEFPSLYRSVDCVVQPSRGEGWGRPHMEAMAMAVPVIATNWSGNTAFMTQDNSLLIQVEKLVEIASGPFQGHRWAEPSKDHLVRLMLDAVVMKQRRSSRGEQDELQALGQRARQDVLSRFDSRTVAQLIVDRAVTLLGEETKKIALLRSMTMGAGDMDHGSEL
jgi:glycosyltransferase involved in cell wall biosynthesis